MLSSWHRLCAQPWSSLRLSTLWLVSLASWNAPLFRMRGVFRKLCKWGTVNGSSMWPCLPPELHCGVVGGGTTLLPCVSLAQLQKKAKYYCTAALLKKDCKTDCHKPTVSSVIFRTGLIAVNLMTNLILWDWNFMIYTVQFYVYSIFNVFLWVIFYFLYLIYNTDYIQVTMF